MILLLEGKKKLKSTMGLDIWSSADRLAFANVHKQYMVSRRIGNDSRDKGKNLMGVQWMWLIRGLD